MGFLVLLWWPVLLLFILLYCIVSAVNKLEVINFNRGLTFLSSCEIFARRKETAWLERL